MPVLGLSIHILLALFFAVHCVRSRQNLYWLIILFSFPLLGSIVYLLAIYLPETRLEHGARKVVHAAIQTLNPEKELRSAQDAFEQTPTIQNRLRLAEAQTQRGLYDEAIQNYEAGLSGAFASDPRVRMGIARALIQAGRSAEAIPHLQSIEPTVTGHAEENLLLLLAEAYAGDSQNNEARAIYEQATNRFGSFTAKAEYAIWAVTHDDFTTAARLIPELEQISNRWNRQTRSLNLPILRKLKAAIDLLDEKHPSSS